MAKEEEPFWKLKHLSDRQLLERLRGVLHKQRCGLAELIAHLGEVEERRLHLAAAHGSLFSYCVAQLGMSEDEACRRIELARLARRFPLLFGELASGRISLSGALLLKPVLTPDNHAELLAAARGASLRAARELLAARFPSPDAPSMIRKLPERPTSPTMPPAIVDVINVMPAPVVGVVPAQVTIPRTATTSAPTSSQQSPGATESALASLAGVRAPSLLPVPSTPAESSPAPAPAGLPHADPRPRLDRPHIDRSRIEPLSAGRYRVQFTADAHLKQKLELARDLLRHSHPSGDFAPIVSRALDLLLQELLQRRFGVRSKAASQRSARTASQAMPAMAAAAPAIETPPSSTSQCPAPPLALRAPAPPAAASSLAPPCAPPRSAARPSSAPVATRAPVPSGAAPSVAADSAPPRSAAKTPSSPNVSLPAPAPPGVALAPPAAAAPSSTPPGASPSAAARTSRIARAARRALLERDGLGCTWVDAEGNRCASMAWLEMDHQHPSGKGGSSEPDNLRLLCRAHNRFAAERAYGRDRVERAIQAHQRSARRHHRSAEPPSSSPAPV